MSYVIIIIAMVILSAYFSATETAFLSLNRTRMNAMAEKGDRRAALVCTLHDQYDKLISTILIGNNIVNIVAASVGTVLFVDLYGADLGATISTAVITVVILVFSEITPKSIVKDCPEAFAKFSAPIINTLIIVFTPLNFLFSAWKKMIAKLLRLKSDTKMSQEELSMLVDEVQEDGVIDEEESTLIHNAINFSDLRADDVLTHRVELEGVSVDADKSEIARVFSETKFSRLLVYEDSPDKIVGVIHLKDFYTGEGISPLPLTEIMTPPVFAMPAEKIDDLLRRLQQNKSHIAVILDEYGGTLGIVTMEDILEQLVGDIWDEHDEVTEDFEAVNDSICRVSGGVLLDEFADRYGIRPESDSTTLGGWIAEQLGRIPAEGDEITAESLKIRVLTLDGHRADQLEVEKLTDEETQKKEEKESV